jgi:hypothetical protein
MKTNTMPRQYLDPKQPLAIEPNADRNVERISDCCLDVRPKSSYLFGRGRGGGAWWMIWMGIFFSGPFMFIGIYTHDVINGFLFFLFIGSFFAFSLLWPLHVWKTHLPLRFNRKTRKVYFHWKGKTYVENWDEVKAYLKVQFLVTATGAPLNDPQINLEFHNEDGSTFTVFLMGVDRDDLTTDQEAAAFWEYIRRYMEEGPEKLPAPDWGIYAPLEFKELVHAHNPLPVLKSKRKWLWPFEVILFFPVRCIWFSIAYPTEVIYYFVEKHVQTNPFPPEMEEACNRDESVKVWYPKQRTEKAA